MFRLVGQVLVPSLRPFPLRGKMRQAQSKEYANTLGPKMPMSTQRRVCVLHRATCKSNLFEQQRVSTSYPKHVFHLCLLDSRTASCKACSSR